MTWDLADYRAELTTLLSLDDCTPEITDAELDRAVNQAVSVLNRYYPQELVAQMVYNETVSDEAFTSAGTHATAKALANKPIRFGSETVVDGSTTFTRNTDYEMDYINGAIKTLSSGSMEVSTAYTISYKMDSTMLDISSLLTEPISIDRVDVINTEQIPVIYDSWAVHGDFLIILSSGNKSQQSLIDNDHIRIYYYSQHTEPTVTVSGSFPAIFDELVLHGAAGYALLIHGIEQEHLAVADIALARSSLTGISDLAIDIQEERTDFATAQAAAETALNVVSSEIGNACGNIFTTLSLAQAEIALSNAVVDKIDATTTGPIDISEAELADLKTMLTISSSAIKTALDKVSTHGTGGSNSVLTSLTNLSTEANLANAALDKIDAQILTGTRNADLYLDTGDALFNAVNLGRDAGILNIQAAQAKISMAQGFIQEATGRVAHSQVLATQASQWNQLVSNFIGEAQSYIAAAQAKIAIVNSNLGVVNAYATQAQSYISNAVQYIQQALAYTQAYSLAIREAEGRIASAAQHVAMAGVLASTTQTKINDAQIRVSHAQSEQSQASWYQMEGNRRVGEYIRVLSDRSHFNTHPRASAASQYASEGHRQFLSWNRLGVF